MKRLIKRSGLVMFITIFTLTGCLRAANDFDPENLPPRALSTETPIPELPEGMVVTSIVTEVITEVVTEVVTEVITEMEIITEFVVVTATPDPQAAFLLSLTPQSFAPTLIPSFTPMVESAQFVVPTETPFVFEGILPTETPDEFSAASVAQSVGGPELQQEDPTPEFESFDEFFPTPEDPLLQQATQIIAEATQRSLDETATAQGPQITVPTFTPTPDPNLQPLPTETPFQQQPVFGGANCVHEVRAGENMFRLSLRYGVPIVDIANASGVQNPNIILVGQMLTIPGCGTTGVFPPPTSLPTQQFGTGGPFGTSASVTGGSAGGIQHVVQQYETLFQISLRYNVPMNNIAIANGITNPNLIIIGQVLTIP